jgi:hypothetical protein
LPTNPSSLKIWLSFEKLVQTMTVDSRCWLECLALDEGQEDSDCKLRAVDGIAAISELNTDLKAITTIYR